MRTPSPLRPIPLPLCLLLPCVAALAACSGRDGAKGVNTAFQLKNTPHGVAGTTPLILDGQWVAYLADEASTGAGTELNADGDGVPADSVPVRVHTRTNEVQVVRTAVDTDGLAPDRTLLFVDQTLFMIVDEAEDGGQDLNGKGGADDLLLCYQTPGATEPTVVDEFSGAGSFWMVAVGNRLFYTASTTAPTSEFDTDLFMVQVNSSGGAPSAPVQVTSTIQDPIGDGVSVQILAQDEGLIFLTMDETVDGDLNGDGDATDTILAILDGTVSSAQVISTELGVAGPATPVRARFKGNDWLVAFLVNEAAEGTSFDDTLLFGPQWDVDCHGNTLDDDDTDDDVLHWLKFRAWELDQETDAPTNTGLPGTLGEPVYVHAKNFVGVASLESDQGPTGCDMNGDGDTVDRIFRWLDVDNPTAFVTDPDKLLALTATVPGVPSSDTTGGVVVLDDFWVLLVDEAADGRNHDDEPGIDNLLIGIHDPSNAGTGWNFDHEDEDGGLTSYVSATWMAQDPSSTARFFMAFDEGVFGFDRNLDGDLNDSVFTLPRRESAVTLEFPGFGVGLAADNAGIGSAGGFSFYRVSEAAEGKDLNGDGDAADYVLQWIGLATGNPPAFLGTLNDLGRTAVAFAPGRTPAAGAFIFDESQQGTSGMDINGDGDGTDLVVRYFRLPE